MDALKACAFRLLARREHSRFELQQKFLARHFSPAIIETMLDWLQEKGYQNDARFTQVYIRSRLRRGYGALKITGELRERGIQDKALLTEFFPADDASWQPQLLALWRKKFGASAEQNSVEHAKQMRFFLARGFSTSQIKKLWVSLHEYE
jgi:regulatory protein